MCFNLQKRDCSDLLQLTLGINTKPRPPGSDAPLISNDALFT